MLFSRKENDKDTQPDQGAAKRLGLSKVVYGFGMAARDSLATLVAVTVAAFPVIYYGQQRSKAIDTLAAWPDKVHSWWKNLLGERSSKAGKALTVAFGIGSIVSTVAHLPGLIRGPLKVKEAEAAFNDEVDANIALHKENTKLTEALKHKDLRITELEKQKGTYVERVSAQEAAAGKSIGI